MGAIKTGIIMEAQAKGFEAVEKQVKSIADALTKLSNKKYTNTGFKKFTVELSKGFNSLNTEADKTRGAINKLTESLDKLGSKGRGSNFGQQLAMSGGLKGYIADMEKMVMLQARWYGARTVLFAAIEAPIAAAREIGKYIIEIDKARAEMLRWGATSGFVSKQMEKDTELIVIQIRKATTEFPVAFADLSKSVQAFVGAGIGPSVIARMIPDIARIQTAFKEIDFNTFAVALTGAFNVFKSSIRGAADEAEAFAAIIDKLMKAQATGIIRPEQFTQVLQYMSQVGRISGFTLDQILAISVALTDTGIRAQSASRLMASLMLTLQTPERINYLRQTGIDIDRNIPLAQQFDKLITDLGKKMGSAPISVGWVAFLTKIAGKEQAKDLITMITNMERYKTLTKELEALKGGGLVEAAKVMSMPISSQWEIFLSILKEIGAGIGSSAVLYLRKIMGLMVDIANGALVAADGSRIFADRLEKLGPAGKLVYDSIRLVADVFGSLLQAFESITISGNYLISFFGKFTTTFGQSVDSFRIGVEAMLVVLIGATRHPAWAAFAVTAFAISEWIRYMSKGMNEMDKKDSAFAFLMSTGKSSDIKAKIAELEAMKKTLDVMSRGGGDPLAIQKSLNQVNYQIAIAKNTLASMSIKIKKRTDTKNGKPSPPEDIKGYESRLREATMKELRMDNQVAELHRQQALASLEYEHKVLGMSDADYNAEKNRLAQEAVDEQVANIEAAAKRISILLDKEMEHARYNQEKKLAIVAVWDSTQAELAKMRLKVETDAVKAGFTERIKDYEDYKKFVERSEKAIYESKVANIDTVVDVEKTNLEIRKSIIEDLYLRGEIRAKEYYKTLTEIAIKETNNQIMAEEQKLQAFVDQENELNTKLSEIGKAIPADEQEKLDLAREAKVEETTAKIIKLRAELQKLMSDLGLKAVETPELVYESFGGGLVETGKTFTKFFDAAIKGFDDMGLQLKNLAESVAKGITSSFEELFFDVMTNDLKSVNDYFKSIMNSMARAASQMLSQLAVAGLRGVISSYFNTSEKMAPTTGGGTTPTTVFHAGGTVGKTSFPTRFVPSGIFANAPRYHSGLAGDEMPAILQKGETVIPKGSGLGLQSVVVNVKNETSTPVESKNVRVNFDLEKMVVGIILKNKQQNGPLRYA